MSGWLIAIIAVVFGGGIMVLLWSLISRAARRTAKEWLEMNPGETIALYANGSNCAAFPGEKITLRGNGLLILTETDLHFQMWAPKKILKIALGRIEHVNIVKKFAGRRTRIPMLHIVFRIADGELLETAFTVVGAESWVDAIRSYAHGSAKFGINTEDRDNGR